jgi:putative polyketide hydroxylase
MSAIVLPSLGPKPPPLPRRVPVLIVGGGPVGLVAAIMLSRLQVPCAVVERRSGVSIHPKARGFNARTLEIFRQYGIDQAAYRSQPPRERVRQFAMGQSLYDPALELRPFQIGDLDPTPLSPCRGSVGSQDALEFALLNALLASPNAPIWHDTELIDLRNAADHVVSVVRGKDGATHTIESTYVIAADGARSPTRALLGGRLVADDALTENINVLFSADLAERMEQLRCIFILTRSGADVSALAGVPTRRDPNEWTYNFRYFPERGEQLQHFDAARCSERVCAAIGRSDIAVRINGIADWSATAAVAERWRFGRVFLAGDAAHLMPPAGGLGMNTGVQDVHDLCWRLALALEHRAGDGLLGDYEVERRSAAQTVVNAATRNLQRAQSGEGPASLWRGPQYGLIFGTTYTAGTLVADCVAKAPDGDGYAYEPSGAPGMRLPHFWLDSAAHFSSNDLFGAQFVLLTPPNATDWRNAANDWLGSGSVGIDVRTVPETILVPPLERPWTDVLDVSHNGAVLVRPDGIIAWRTNAPPRAPDALLQVMRHLLDLKDS